MSDQNETEEPEEEKTILIIGISSFVGSNLAQYLKKYYKIIGTYYQNPVKVDGILTLPMNIKNKDEVRRVLFSFKPDYTIYCAGVNSITECSQNTNRSDSLNTNGLITVSEYCQRYKSQICYLSSCHVFSGEEKKNIEMDIPDSNTSYGKSQAAAEFYIQKTSLNYIIFRACRLYGRSLKMSNPNIFENFQKEFHQGQSVTCDNHVSTGFLDIYYMAAMIKICFEKEVKNRLFQVSTTDIMTPFEFANAYCEVFQQGKANISKGKWKYPLLKGASGVDGGDKFFLQMDISNLEGFLSIKLPSIEESLAFTFKRLNGSKAKENKKESKGEGIQFI
jgi:dTDP-4-dehydrorhamnose reductase